MCPDVSLCAERFSDLSCGAIITFHDRKHAFDWAQPRGERGNEKQHFFNKIPKNSNAKRICKWHVTKQNKVARCQGKVFNHSTSWLELLYEPRLRATLRSPSVSTKPRTDDVVVLFELDLTCNVLLLREYTFTLRLFRPKEADRIKKQSDTPVLYADREVSGSLSFRFQRDMAMRELGLSFCDCVPVFSGPEQQTIERQRQPWELLSPLLLSVR